MSLGLVVLEKKLFTRTRTPTPQSDDIKILLLSVRIDCHVEDLYGTKIKGAVSNIRTDNVSHE